MMRYFWLFCVLFFSACASVAPSDGVFKKRDTSLSDAFKGVRPNVQQGVFVSTKNLKSLYKGMSRADVFFTLKVRPLHNPFQNNRVIYAFRYVTKDNYMYTSLLVLDFDKDNKLVKIGPKNLIDDKILMRFLYSHND